MGGAASCSQCRQHGPLPIGLGGEHSGVLSAIMNTAGQIGGVLSPIVLAYIVEHFSNWSMPLPSSVLLVLDRRHLLDAYSSGTGQTRARGVAYGLVFMRPRSASLTLPTTKIRNGGDERQDLSIDAFAPTCIW